MNRTYEDMSKEELVTLVTRLAKQHDEWSAEAKRLRGTLGDITAIDEWGGDGKDVGITITFSEGNSYMGWLEKCDDEVKE